MKNIIYRNWMILVPVLSIVLVSSVYVWHFGWYINPLEGNSIGYGAFGQFGDYFGGLLNPLLAFINIALLAWYQKTSIAKTGEKDVIFRMLELHRRNVESLEVREKEKPEKRGEEAEAESNSGLRAFWVFDKEVRNNFQGDWRNRENTNVGRLAALDKAYDKFYHEKFRKQYLGHYFRNLYHIFKIIDASDVFSPDEKLQFAKIVRAQLSHLELKFLYLNCRSTDGQAFKRLVGRYNILEWIRDVDFSNYAAEFKESSDVLEEIASWVKANPQ